MKSINIFATVAIGNLERHMRKASHHGSKQHRDHALQSLLLLLAHATHMMVNSSRTSVRGESHNQRNTTEEVATTPPPFYNEPHRSHVLCVKAELRTTFTSWSQHHFVAIGTPERHMRKALHRGSKQQRSCVAISLTIACSRYTYDGVILPAHPVRGESHNQRSTTGEVATLQGS